jgi:hypothetical protein
MWYVRETTGLTFSLSLFLSLDLFQVDALKEKIKELQDTTIVAQLNEQVGGGVGVNGWAGRREWCRGQERECFILQYVTT